jgi:toxin-antitoxin system PIN domain toxin
LILPDINVLLYAYNQRSPFHERAARWWAEVLSGDEAVGLASVTAFGFLRLSTQAHIFDQPLEADEAVHELRLWLERPVVRWLEADRRVADRAFSLISATGTAGNLVTDVQLAALALEHGAVVYTADADFTRLAGVRWQNPCA